MINGNTKVVGLIGNPVEHSFSPTMHNSAFDKLGLNYRYLAFKVEEKSLKRAIYGAENLNIIGLNVTIPHKINVIKYLDDLDPVASKIGAVNTIDLRTLKGYNTDGVGAMRALEEVTSLKGKNVVVAGAGGASRAICFNLVEKNVGSLTILNRNVEKASLLSGEIGVNYDSINEIASYLEDADILIDTTPIGMDPNINDKPIATSDMMHEDLVVNDIVYNPLETVLLKEASKVGDKTVSGLKMLLYQGVESFKIFTGVEAPVDVMENELLKLI